MYARIAKVIEMCKERFRIVRSHITATVNLQFSIKISDFSLDLLISKLKLVDQIFERID